MDQVPQTCTDTMTSHAVSLGLVCIDIVRAKHSVQIYSPRDYEPWNEHYYCIMLTSILKTYSSYFIIHEQYSKGIGLNTDRFII